MAVFERELLSEQPIFPRLWEEEYMTCSTTKNEGLGNGEVIPMKYGSLSFFYVPISIRPEQTRHQEDSLRTTCFSERSFFIKGKMWVPLEEYPGASLNILSARAL